MCELTSDVLGCRGEAQIAEEQSDEDGGLRFGRGGPRCPGVVLVGAALSRGGGDRRRVAAGAGRYPAGLAPRGSGALVWSYFT